MKRIIFVFGILMFTSGCHSSKFVGIWTSKCSTIFNGGKSCPPQDTVFQTVVKIYPNGTFERHDNGREYLWIEKGKWENSFSEKLSLVGEDAESMASKSVKFDKMPRSTNIYKTVFTKASTQTNGRSLIADEIDLEILEAKVYEDEMNGFAKKLATGYVEEFVKTEEITE